MSLGKRREKILDGEALFYHYYVEMGDGRSQNKLAKWAVKQWGPNPETGQTWSNGGTWQSMWRWVFENLDQAKKVYKEVSMNYFLKVIQTTNPNAVWSDEQFEEEWLEKVAKHAHTCMTKTQYRRFLNQHPEFSDYEVMVEKK